MMDPAMMSEPLPEVLRWTMRNGAPLYNQGDYKGCAKAFLYTAEQSLSVQRAATELHGTRHGQLLRIASEEAKHMIDHDPMEAAWVLRRAFDKILTSKNEPTTMTTVTNDDVSAASENSPKMIMPESPTQPEDAGKTEAQRFEAIVTSMKLSPSTPDIQRGGCLALAGALAPPMSGELRGLASRFVKELDGLDIIIRVMEKWAEDPVMQEAAIRLLCCLTFVPGARPRMNDQGVVSLVALTLERFPSDQSIKAVATPFMNTMMTTMLRVSSSRSLKQRTSSETNLMKLADDGQKSSSPGRSEANNSKTGEVQEKKLSSTRSLSSTNSLTKLLDEDEDTKPTISKEQVRNLFTLWNAALQTGDSRLVAKRYSKNALLLPTVSDEPRTTPEGIQDYFDHFLTLKPQGVIVDGIVTVGDGWAQDAGIYEFALGSTGDKVRARYSFVYNYEKGTDRWLIGHHHSSAMPEASKEAATKITEDQVRGLFQLWNDSLDTGDASLVAKRYSSSAVLLPTVSDEPRTTTEGIVDYFVHFCEKKPVGVILESHVNIGANWCKDVGIYEFTMGDDGSKVRARYSFVYVWENGSWLISHHHSSAMPEGGSNKLPKSPSQCSIGSKTGMSLMKKSPSQHSTGTTAAWSIGDASSICSEDAEFEAGPGLRLWTHEV